MFLARIHFLRDGAAIGVAKRRFKRFGEALADVVAHLPEMLARGNDPQRTKIGHTGGSTGKPLAFYYDEAKHELMRAGMMRSYMLSGWRPGQKILNFWGARQDTARAAVAYAILVLGTMLVWQAGTVLHPARPVSSIGVLAVWLGSALMRRAANS